MSSSKQPINLVSHLTKDERKAQRLGDHWSSINFEVFETITMPKDGSQPKVGKLKIGNASVEVTVSEMNRLIEELNDALTVVHRARRLNLINVVG